MKKYNKLAILTLLLALSLLGCAATKNESKETGSNDKKTSFVYKDGVYDAQTEPDAEGFLSKAKVSIEDGKISEIEWNIVGMNNRVFDETYEEVFAGNELYQEQCRNDLKGAKTYGPKLIEVQNLDEVDAMTGATWANKKFKEVMQLVLADATKK